MYLRMALSFIGGTCFYTGGLDACSLVPAQARKRAVKAKNECERVQAHGVIGNEGSTPTEVEQAPAVSLTLASMEGADVTSFTVTGERLPDAGAPLLSGIHAILQVSHLSMRLLGQALSCRCLCTVDHPLAAT